MKKDAVIEEGNHIKLFPWRTAKRKCIQYFELYPTQNEIMGINKSVWDYITSPGTDIRVRTVTKISVFCKVFPADGTDDFNLFIPKCVIKAMWKCA